MLASFRNVEEKCIICSIKNIYLLTKWSGHFCFQFGCEHSRTTQTFSLSKKYISIAIFLWIFPLFGAGDSIISLIHGNYSGNGTFFRLLFILLVDIGLCLCVIIFLSQIKIAKITLTQLVDIINDSTLFRIGKHFSKNQLKIYEYKSLFLCFLLILSIIVIVFFYRLFGSDPHISYFQEISLYVICYYNLSYTLAMFMSIDVYRLLMKVFEKYVKMLVSNIIRNNNEVIVMHNIDKLRNISKFYLKVYFCFQQFISYYNPVIVILMLIVSSGFLLLVLSASFYALEGKIDYFSITLVLLNVLFPASLLYNAEILMRHVSIVNINFSLINCYQGGNSLLGTLSFIFLFICVEN